MKVGLPEGLSPQGQQALFLKAQEFPTPSRINDPTSNAVVAVLFGVVIANFGSPFSGVARGDPANFERGRLSRTLILTGAFAA
jgi:hypothetical protein